MFLNLYTQNIKVFLSAVTVDMESLRNSVKNILLKAGIEIVEQKEDLTPGQLLDLMLSANCSMHILGNINICDQDSAVYQTPPAQHYRTAKGIDSKEYKMFVWNPSGTINDNNQYINIVRRNIDDNTIYSDITSPIVFVEELRSIMNLKPEVKAAHDAYDILFIYNSLDKDSAREITNMLGDLHTVVNLEINADTNTDYMDFILSQLPLCKMGTVYYDFAGDWAVPFAQQVWKQIGGAGSATQLFIAGNSSHADETQLKPLKKIMAYSINEKSIIPLDIKIYYDKLTGKNNTQ
ncbi:MAG: hypothetical protein IKR94_09215 [Bacteroidales bacterium]|nr:hypothetical protein [Bacteroidales bacterium]MBR4215483.1 hypothetical protein [Bacteroidales bacterium]